jgi:hypothetical protein
MPDISKITDVLYDGNQPYHVHYDNLPLKNILTRIDLVNAQVDINTDILRGSCGSVGTLSNRLSVSLQDNGKLKDTAVDNSLHNIGAHSDGSYDGVDYVRMKQDERDKLFLIESNANSLELEIEDSISNEQVEHIFVQNGLIKFKASDTIAFQFIAPDMIKAHSIYPYEAAHIHNYNITPAHQTPSTPDYINYITTSVNTPYKEGSLKVYINGMRLGFGAEQEIKVLTGSDPSVSVNWTGYYVDSDSFETGEFSLNTSITASDVIVIDFDQSL